MKRITVVAATVVLAILWVAPAPAQDLMVYPANGQSNEQVEKDKFACYSWAKGETGFDPMQTPTATSPPPTKQATTSTA
ncbi:MAG: hypothetical protein PVH30_00120, partial [Desulfobacterales bacterium]